MTTSAEHVFQDKELNTHWCGERSMDSEEKRLMIERFVHAYNSFDIDGMLELLQHDIRYRYIADGKVVAAAHGVADFRVLAQQSRDLYSSRKQTVMEYHEKSGKVVVEIAYAAVRAVDFPDGSKAGDMICLKGLSEFTFEDGKICSLTDFS